MSWGLSMPYQKQPNLSWVPDLGRNLFFGTLGDSCNMLTSLPVLRDVWKLYLKRGWEGAPPYPGGFSPAGGFLPARAPQLKVRSPPHGWLCLPEASFRHFNSFSRAEKEGKIPHPIGTVTASRGWHSQDCFLKEKSRMRRLGAEGKGWIPCRMLYESWNRNKTPGGDEAYIYIQPVLRDKALRLIKGRKKHQG